MRTFEEQVIEVANKLHGTMTLELDDNREHIKNIEYTSKEGYKSYIDVVTKGKFSRMFCYGDYKTLVFGDMYNYNIDEISTWNYEYYKGKVEAGEIERFDYNQFVSDVKEYLKESFEDDLENEKYQEALDCLTLADIDEYRCVHFLDDLSNILNDNEVYCKDFGKVPHPHFVVWMAIIKIAQEKYKKFKEINWNVSKIKTINENELDYITENKTIFYTDYVPFNQKEYFSYARVFSFNF